MIVLFLFYVDLISVAATVAEITWYRFVFGEGEFGTGSWKNKFFIFENSWNFIVSHWAPWSKILKKITKCTLYWNYSAFPRLNSSDYHAWSQTFYLLGLFSFPGLDSLDFPDCISDIPLTGFLRSPWLDSKHLVDWIPDIPFTGFLRFPWLDSRHSLYWSPQISLGWIPDNPLTKRQQV